MLTIHVIKNADDAKEYHGIDNYYAKDSLEAKASSQWWGKGAAALGLTGQIDTQTFGDLLDGKLPDGTQLGRISKKAPVHRPGYDLTFSAPKSASIMGLVWQDKLILDAHDKAVDHALSYLEREASQTRQKVNGRLESVRCDNFTVAKYRHHTSRAQDPQIHTHCVVMNMVRLPCGEWRSLSSEEIFNHKMVAGVVYRNQLAIELMKIGYELVQIDAQGNFEIKGIEREEIEIFSKRHEEIQKKMAELGLTSYEDSKRIAQQIRDAKEDVDSDILLEKWLEETMLDRRMYPSQARERGDISNTNSPAHIKAALAHARESITEKKAVFRQLDLVREALNVEVILTNLADIEAEIKTLMQEGKLIATHKDFFTTPEMVALEKDNLRRLDKAKGAVTPMLPERDINAVLAEHRLTSGQKEAISLILTTRDAIVGIQGYAGTGKTTLQSHINRYLQETSETLGFEVTGLAPTGKAARELWQSIGIPCDTVSQFILDFKLHPEKLKDSKRFIILDEASMLSSQAMNDVLKAFSSLHPESRLILQGDFKQLEAVSAGRPFLQFLAKGMAHTDMRDIVRQEPGSNLKAAVESTISNEVSEAFQLLKGKIVEIEDRQERLARVAEDYLSRSKSVRKRTLVVTPANADRNLVNDLIREGLKSEGTLKGEAVQADILVSKNIDVAGQQQILNYTKDDILRFNVRHQSLQPKQYYRVLEVDIPGSMLTLVNDAGEPIQLNPNTLKQGGMVEIYRHESRELMVGERIRWRRVIDKSQGIVNAETAIILSITADDITFKTSDKQLHTVSRSNHQYQHFDYAYASTVYTVQGQTADYVIGNIDSIQTLLTLLNSFYVTISRARKTSTLYVDNIEQCERVLSSQKKEASLSALEALYGENYENYKTMSLSQNQRSYVPNDVVNPPAMPSFDVTPAQSDSIYESYLNQQPPEMDEANAQDYFEYETTLDTNTPEQSTQSQRESVNHNAANTAKKMYPARSQRPFWDINSINTLLPEHVESLAVEMLGNYKHKHPDKLLFGSKKGSLHVQTTGEKCGMWYDHQIGKGGNIFQLVAQKKGLGVRDSIDYVGRYVNCLAQAGYVNLAKPNLAAKLNHTNEVKEKDELSIKRAQSIERRSVPIQGTIADVYLRQHRGIKSPNLPENLRFIERWYDRETDKQYPALLSIAKDVKGETQAVQVTLLDQKTAKKADIDINKRTLGRMIFGAMVTINSGDPSKHRLVCEGIETALSVRDAFPNHTILATLSVGNFKHVSQDRGEKIMLLVDNDGINSPSLESVENTIELLEKADKIVSHTMPELEGSDFNDLGKTHGTEAVFSHIETAIRDFEDSLILSEMHQEILLDDATTKQEKDIEREIEPSKSQVQMEL